MWTSLRHLAAQQTTAPELATFLVLVTVICVGISLLSYAVIMTAAWAIVLRGEKSWRSVVLPSTQTLREHAAEYGLAFVTSAILGLTLAEKDRLVDRVLGMPASAFIDSSVVANVFPLGRLPTGAEVRLKGSTFHDEVMKSATTNLAGLVQGPLEAGRAEGVRAIFVAAAKDVLKHTGIAAQVASVLKLLAILMMAVYVGWVAARRIRALARKADDAAELNQDVARQLVVLGVCLALLLANPLGNPGADLLADSAVSAARVAPPQSALIRELTVTGIQVQNKVLASGTMGRDSVARGKLEALRDSLKLLEDSLNLAQQKLRELDDMVRHSVQLAGDNTTNSVKQLQQLSSEIEELRNRALLFVYNAGRTPFHVDGPKLSRVDTSYGLHWGLPGTYRVRDMAGNVLLSLDLQRGESRTVCIIAPMVTTRIAVIPCR